MHKKKIKSLFALSLCAALTAQNVMLVANAEEANTNLENEVTIISSDELQLESQDSNLNTEENSTEGVESQEETVEQTTEEVEITSNNSDIQVDPEENNTYSMGGGLARSASLYSNVEMATLTNPNAIGVGTVTTDNLNVRSGPSTSNEKIGTLKLDDTVEVLGKSNGWYKIDFEGKEAYISGVYLQLKPLEKGIDVSKWNGDIDWQSVKNAGVDYVIIRAGYGTSTVDEKFYQNIEGARDAGLKIGIYWFSYATSPEKAQIEAQKCLEVISAYKGNINYPVFFDYEYASRDYAEKQGVSVTKELTTEIANTFINTVKSAGYATGIYTNKDFGNTYFSADTLNSNNLWIAQYSSVNSYGKAYSMWQYSDKGSVAGISGDVDLNYTCLIPEGVTINAGGGSDNTTQPETPVQPETPAEPEAPVQPETPAEPEVTSEQGVTTANLNLRQGASTSTAKITTIPKGKTIEIVDKSISGWYKVVYNGTTGYVSSEYVSIGGSSNDNTTSQPETTSEQGVTTANLNLRKGASTSTAKITTIPKGKSIEIVDKSISGWYKVVYNGTTGYVSSEYVSIGGSSNDNTTSQPETTSEQGVTTANLNLRKGASTSTAKITTIPKGKTIEIVDKSISGWYKVVYNGTTGYVSSEYVSIGGTTSTPSTSTSYGITTDNLNLRKGMSTSSARITTIKKGTKIEILDKSNSSWYKVKYNGQTGYVSSQYVRL